MRADAGAVPVTQYNVREELVFAKAALDTSMAIAPRPELFDDPCGETNGRVVERMCERLRLRHLQACIRALGQGRRVRVDERLLRWGE